VIRETLIPIGTRVRLRRVHDFLTMESADATVIGPGESPGLVQIRLDRPARCRFEDDEQYDVQEMAEAVENLDVITAESWRIEGRSSD
jgi:hypothetical protein